MFHSSEQGGGLVRSSLFIEQLNAHVSLHSRLASQSMRVIGDSHVLLSVITRAEVQHPFGDVTHARRAEAIAATGMFQRDARIECDS